MAEVEVRHEEPFIKLVGKKFQVSLSHANPPIYWCDSCGCMFLGNAEGDQGFYPDRYEMVGMTGNGCVTECACHEMPYMMDNEGNATEF